MNLKRVDIIFEECNVLELLHQFYTMPSEDIIQMVKESGLKGRGGAGFLTGTKWEMAAHENSEEKYVICNADEGEPGTFKDREILTQVPLKVFGGMALCAKAIKATKGYIYLRGEYSYLRPSLEKVLKKFNANIKSHFNFTIEIKMGSGAYICGEETALIESMEGKRGEPRNKPPYPTQQGYRNKPTVINNVETLVYALMICKYGGKRFKKLGTQSSRGSKIFCISGDTTKPGIYELELGMLLKDFVDEFGDGDTKAVQVGGASGYCVPRKLFNKTIIGFEGIPTGGSMMLFNSSRSMYNILENYLEFFHEESCGQCTPCRVGCQQLFNGIHAVKKGVKSSEYLATLSHLAETMKVTAKCGLGQSVANPFLSIVENFKEEILY